MKRTWNFNGPLMRCNATDGTFVEGLLTKVSWESEELGNIPQEARVLPMTATITLENAYGETPLGSVVKELKKPAPKSAAKEPASVLPEERVRQMWDLISFHDQPHWKGEFLVSITGAELKALLIALDGRDGLEQSRQFAFEDLEKARAEIKDLTEGKVPVPREKLVTLLNRFVELAGEISVLRGVILREDMRLQNAKHRR